MVKLRCALVGVQRSVIPVDIEVPQSVEELKEAITEKGNCRITCDADEL
jgi:hypothetical protein